MRWFVIPSILTCGLNFVLAAIILSLSTYYFLFNKSINAPTTRNEEWIRLVINLIPFFAVWMIVSMAGIFVSMSKRQIVLAALVLAFYACGFGTSVYFTTTFGTQLETEDVKGDAETLFQSTLKQVNSQSSELWLPEWLDSIQKLSKQCCGVVTYRDYELFWPYAPTRIPRSCCRDEVLADCPDDLNQIPFPNTPDNFLKVETGCMEEINDASRRHIEESYNMCIAINIFLGVGTIAFTMLFIRRYLMGKSDSRAVKGRRQGGGGDVAYTKDDNLMAESGAAIPVASNGNIGSVNSLDDAKALASIESVPVQERRASFVSEPRPKEPKQAPPMRSSSMVRINRANTVFAGLQLPEASTGDDMTVGGGNLGRREVFVAQDATPAPTSVPEPQQQNLSSRTRIPKSSSQNDIASDIIHVDPVPEPTPIRPSSPERARKKKARKAALKGHFERNQ